MKQPSASTNPLNQPEAFPIEQLTSHTVLLERQAEIWISYLPQYVFRKRHKVTNSAPYLGILQ
jgi:hypothetical protein